MTKIALGIGLDDLQPQVRFELSSKDDAIELVAMHGHEPDRAEVVAVFQADDEGKVECWLRPIKGPMLCHAFGITAGHLIPLSLAAAVENRATGPGLHMSHHDAIELRDLLQAGDIDLAIKTIDERLSFVGCSPCDVTPGIIVWPKHEFLVEDIKIVQTEGGFDIVGHAEQRTHDSTSAVDD